MGGMTAFSQAGIQIPVETGAAVVWHNTLSSGAWDEMSYHGGCPVIFGQKRSKGSAHLTQHYSGQQDFRNSAFLYSFHHSAELYRPNSSQVLEGSGEAGGIFGEWRIKVWLHMRSYARKIKVLMKQGHKNVK